MPTIFRWKGFRFHFFSNEGMEPPHVHVRRGEDSCKFWLRPVGLGYNHGMTTREVADLERIVVDHAEEFERKWHEYFQR